MLLNIQCVFTLMLLNMQCVFLRSSKKRWNAHDGRSDRILDQSLLPTWQTCRLAGGRVRVYMWLSEEGVDCWTAGGCRAWINISMSFNGAVSITTSIFCRMIRGWSCLVDRRVVIYFSVPCWRTGQNCVKSESGYSKSLGAYVWGSLCLGEPMS